MARKRVEEMTPAGDVAREFDLPRSSVYWACLQNRVPYARAGRGYFVDVTPEAAEHFRQVARKRAKKAEVRRGSK